MAAVISTDPIDLLLDASGDVVIDSDAHWSSGLAGVAQGIRIALQMFRGEWFLDLEDGVPYLERDGVTAAEALLGQKFDRPRAMREFRAAILRAPDVLSIVSLTVDFVGHTRQMTARWTVTTTFGDLTDSLAKGI